MAGKLDWTRLPAWAVLLSGLVLSVAAYRYVGVQLKNEAQAKFERQSREIHRAIASRLTSYTGLLWGLRGLYQVSGSVSRREFRDYVRGLDLGSRYPAVLSINFAEQISASEKAAFEHRVRNDRSLQPEGYPGFRVLPPGERNQYQVLTMLEPFESKVFGADLELLSKPRFDEVRRSGDFVSSGELVAHQPGLPLALRLAVYKKGMPTDVPEERDEAYLGSLGMGFSLLRLMSEAVPPEVLSLIRIRIYNIGRSRDAEDNTSPAMRSLLIDTASVAAPMSTASKAVVDADEQLSIATRLSFGGALLELSFDSRIEPFAAPQSRLFPAAVLTAGIAASLLLALIVALLQRSRHRLEQAVSDRTAALQSTNRTLGEEIAERNRLQQEVMRVLVDERRGYAQELHDNLGQQLTAAAFLIETLGAELEQSNQTGAGQVKIIQSHLSSVMTQTRELARQLNPVAGNTGGLSSALQELALHARPAPPVEHTLKQFPHRDMSVKFGWPQLLAWLVLSAGLALSIVAYFHFHVRTMDEDRATFEEESREAQRAVETRLETYASLMLGLRSLHLSAGGINDDSLQGYVGKLELPERFPAVQRLDYVRADQARNGPGMFIYPGRYGTERISGNDGLHPTDLEPGLLNEIRDSGDFVLSPVAGQGDIAMPLRLAVYRHNFPIVTVAERRQAFTGSIGMFVSLRQLVKEVVSAQTRGVVRIRIHALPQAGKAMSPTEKLERQLLLDSSGMAELTEAAAFSWAGNEAALHRISRYRLGNAVLEFEFSAAPGSFDSPMSQLLPVFVLLAGLIISLLLFGLLNSLALSRRTLEFAVAERTRQLEAISQALQQEEAERNQLEREISHLNVDERRRFSQDLHDNIAQRLTAIGFMLESLVSEIEAPDRPTVRRTDGREGDGCSPANLSATFKPGLQDAHALALRTGVHIRTAIAHTRMLARGLNPVAVEAGGFISALTHLADSIRETFRIDCHLEHDGCSIPDNAVLQHNLYRITQQAINNALTHGKATRIVIELSENTGDGRGLRLAIMDNGAGFNADPGMNSGLGLEIMRYRCSMLGLGLEIQPIPSGGTAIVIEQRRSKE